MNKDRRTRLQAVIDELNCIIDQEQEAYDNMPQSFQEGERGEKISEGIDTMTEAKDNIEYMLED